MCTHLSTPLIYVSTPVHTTDLCVHTCPCHWSMCTHLSTPLIHVHILGKQRLATTPSFRPLRQKECPPTLSFQHSSPCTSPLSFTVCIASCFFISHLPVASRPTPIYFFSPSFLFCSSGQWRQQCLQNWALPSLQVSPPSVKSLLPVDNLTPTWFSTYFLGSLPCFLSLTFFLPPILQRLESSRPTPGCLSLQFIPVVKGPFLSCWLLMSPLIPGMSSKLIELCYIVTMQHITGNMTKVHFIFTPCTEHQCPCHLPPLSPSSLCLLHNIAFHVIFHSSTNFSPSTIILSWTSTVVSHNVDT